MSAHSLLHSLVVDADLRLARVLAKIHACISRPIRIEVTEATPAPQIRHVLATVDTANNLLEREQPAAIIHGHIYPAEVGIKSQQVGQERSPVRHYLVTLELPASFTGDDEAHPHPRQVTEFQRTAPTPHSAGVSTPPSTAEAFSQGWQCVRGKGTLHPVYEDLSRFHILILLPIACTRSFRLLKMKRSPGVFRRVAMLTRSSR
jgi:hypothetical protein